jgi:hypothetical protein
MTDKTQATDAGAQPATDRDTHFYLAGWNGARGNEDSHEHFRRALHAAPPAPAAVAVPVDLTKRIKDCAAHWAYMERIDHGDQAAVEKQRHAELVDQLAAAPAQAWPSECDSPELCRVHRGCAGQYGTKNTCPSFAVPNPRNSAAPAQEHATQLAGQAVSMSHREWRFALQEAIETMDAEIDSRGDESNVRRMKRAKAVLSTMLAAAPAQAQEDARDALVEHVVSAARNAVDASFEVMDDFTIEGHLVAALSLALDELDAARAAQGGAS